jgi:hypothetical protein
VRRRRVKRQLFWTAVIVAVLLIWLIAQVIRAAQALTWAARRLFRPPVLAAATLIGVRPRSSVDRAAV